MYQFFARLSRMKYINRWGLMRNTINENIAEHSLEVAMIAHALAVIGNTYYGKKLDANYLAVIGMYHDATEIITGDMPTPVKYFAPQIREAYKDVENKAADQMLKGLPEEMQKLYAGYIKTEDVDQELYKYVKAADKLSAYIKCIEEKKMGNQDFSKAAETIKTELKKMQIEEADYFMEHFLPAYTLTVDEQSIKEK